MIINPFFRLASACVAVCAATQAWGAPGESLFDQQQQHQQSQQQARDAQLAPKAPDVRLENDVQPNVDAPFPEEFPCFIIDRVTFTGRDAFPHWVPLQRIADGGVGHCLGVNGINQLMSRVQNELIGHGWVTSRVLAPEQDLRSGTLMLALIPGKIRHEVYSDDADTRAVLFSAMPARPGNLLDLRDIEQGLENLQRLPVVNANMEIVPTERPGESDIVISRQQQRLWHINTWLDDTGTESTGRYQGGMMLALDNPLALSDLFYISASRDLGFGGEKSSKNLTGHYSVPFGYGQFELSGNQSRYQQTVAGLMGDLNYSGKSKNLSSALSRVVQRGSASKTTLRYGVTYRETHNYINDTEIEVQQRRTSAWQLGLTHQHQFGPAALDLGVNYQRGTRWFGAMPAYESENDGDDYATDLSKILTWTANLNLPFALGEQRFRYQLNYLRQTSETPLTSPDQLSIGNRWTVRGFDGERSLSASHGWYLQNTVAWQTPLPQQEWYLGADYGEIGGYSNGYALLGRHLAGGVTGLRGSLGNTGIGYDLFIGIPLSKPSGYVTDPVTFGFSLSWQY